VGVDFFPCIVKSSILMQEKSKIEINKNVRINLNLLIKKKKLTPQIHNQTKKNKCLKSDELKKKKTGKV